MEGVLPNRAHAVEGKPRIVELESPNIADKEILNFAVSTADEPVAWAERPAKADNAPVAAKIFDFIAVQLLTANRPVYIASQL